MSKAPIISNRIPCELWGVLFFSVELAGPCTGFQLSPSSLLLVLTCHWESPELQHVLLEGLEQEKTIKGARKRTD